jgi:hypothetical protein
MKRSNRLARTAVLIFLVLVCSQQSADPCTIKCLK